MKQTSMLAVALLLSLAGYGQLSISDIISGKVGSIPQLVAPGEVSTGMNERDMAISPDGNEIFFSVSNFQAGVSVIMHLELVNGQWKGPTTANFSGEFADIEPAFSPDGKQLFFSSKRPLNSDSLAKGDFDLWVVSKTENGWANPKNVGAEVNGPGNEFYPSVAANGNLYFLASASTNSREENFFVSQLTADGYGKPQILPSLINTDKPEYNGFIAPDESYFIFTAHGYNGEVGGGDLLISFRQPDGTWQTPVLLPEPINSQRLDYCPFVWHNILFFTSTRVKKNEAEDGPLRYSDLQKLHSSPQNGQGDIYAVSFDKVAKLIKRQSNNAD